MKRQKCGCTDKRAPDLCSAGVFQTTRAAETEQDKGRYPAPYSTFVRLFKPKFAGLVLSGEKCQTVRPIPKRMPKPGDTISLRCWTGKPYRSKQRILRDAEISRVEFVEISHDRIVIAGRKLTPDGEWAFSRADGFNTPQDMLDWFDATHGLPFIGVVICWQNALLGTRAEAA